MSPPELIARKRAELDLIGPEGWLRAALLAAAAVPLWLGTAGKLLCEYMWRPAELLQRPDPEPLPPLPFQLQEEYLDVGGGVRLHTVSPGRRPDKPLMLFVHGFPETWYSWRHQMAAFNDGSYDVVAIDMRGYNKSDKPRGVAAYALPRLAADVNAIVHALGHERCTLVAHDWGGLVAWLTAGTYGTSLVERLVIMGSPHAGVFKTNMTPQQQMRSSYMLLFQVRTRAQG